MQKSILSVLLWGMAIDEGHPPFNVLELHMDAENLLSSATVSKVRVNHERLSRDEIVGLTLAPGRIEIGKPLWIFAEHKTHPFYWASTSPVMEVLPINSGELEVMTESRSIYRIRYGTNAFEPAEGDLTRMCVMVTDTPLDPPCR